MEARYTVSLPYLDLTPPESYAQLLDSIEQLDQAAHGVFQAISARVQEDKGAACRAAGARPPLG